MKYAGDKTDVAALIKYTQDLETKNERMRKALLWIMSVAELDRTPQLVDLCSEALGEPSPPRQYVWPGRQNISSHLDKQLKEKWPHGVAGAPVKE